MKFLAFWSPAKSCMFSRINHLELGGFREFKKNNGGSATQLNHLNTTDNMNYTTRLEIKHGKQTRKSQNWSFPWDTMI